MRRVRHQSAHETHPRRQRDSVISSGSPSCGSGANWQARWPYATPDEHATWRQPLTMWFASTGDPGLQPSRRPAHLRRQGHVDGRVLRRHRLPGGVRVSAGRMTDASAQGASRDSAASPPDAYRRGLGQTADTVMVTRAVTCQEGHLEGVEHGPCSTRARSRCLCIGWAEGPDLPRRLQLPRRDLPQRSGECCRLGPKEAPGPATAADLALAIQGWSIVGGQVSGWHNV